METVAKPGRRGPAQNGKLMQDFLELLRFCLLNFRKTHRKRCRAYDIDVIKNRKGNVTTRLMIYQNFENFENLEFQENIVFFLIEIFKD